MKIALACMGWLALLPALALAAPPEDPMQAAVEKASAEIRKHYQDPVIERQECPFPGLLYLTAFERANLAEDPLVPEQWFATLEGAEPGQPGRSFPFEAVHHHPQDEAEARALAHWLLSVERRWSRITATEVVTDAAARRVVITLKAEFSLSHPMFRQGWKPGRAVITVQDGRWSLRVDDPFLERVERKK
ncbi:MAG TPA: hypothetical protein PK668_04900 [Myxococcota bacterium]|nr:hypothetical protein [Myxococcota bacterium]HRY92200.1 hypothetical protein [Myxococcota bacterium]HSA22156.1 hypothetical protein [Myxococcota bacterium]